MLLFLDVWNNHSRMTIVAAVKESSKKADIMRETMVLITERGFHGTSMSLIAQKANVGSGTIYNYFKSKEVLINEIYKDLKEEMHELLLSGDDATLPTRDRFLKMAESISNFYLKRIDVLNFMEQYASSPYITNETREEAKKKMEAIKRFFEDSMKNKELKSMPLPLLYGIFHSIIVSTVKLIHSGDMPRKGLKTGLNALWDAVRA